MKTDNHRIYKMSFSGVYPHYIAKAEKKGRTKAEVDEIIFWLTGYDSVKLQEIIENVSSTTDLEGVSMYTAEREVKKVLYIVVTSNKGLAGAFNSSVIKELNDPFIYNYIDENMPEWARKSVQKAVDKGVLSGTDEGWNLKYDDLRVIVWLDRLGLLE